MLHNPHSLQTPPWSSDMPQPFDTKQEVVSTKRASLQYARSCEALICIAGVPTSRTLNILKVVLITPLVAVVLISAAGSGHHKFFCQALDMVLFVLGVKREHGLMHVLVRHEWRRDLRILLRRHASCTDVLHCP